MGRSKKVEVDLDPDLYRRLYLYDYHLVTSRWDSDIRASGAKGPNTPERLAEIKEKYKDGVPEQAVEDMVDGILSGLYRR